MTSIIHLDRNFLRVYNFDNQTLILIQELIATSKTLELAERFESFWRNLWPDCFSQTDKIYLLINSNSSFTDSRIVYVWLQSWLLFTKGVFGVNQVGIIMDLGRLGLENIKLIFDGSDFANLSLEYSAPARVSLK